MTRILRSLLLLAAALAASALAAATASAQSSPGAVYALTNSPSGNEVAVYDRAADGTLTAAGRVATGGLGTGAGLGSQGAVVLSRDGRLLLAVNAGSDTVSSFAVGPKGIALVDVAPSGGVRPTSVTVHGDLVYVLNAGSPNAISGLRVDARGDLTPIAGSTRALSAAQTNPAQVEFTPDGGALVVTERATNLITTYAVGPTGDVSTITGIQPTGQSAACWTVVTNDGRYAYTTNAASGNVSGYAIDESGALSLLDPSGVTAATAGNPTDAALSVDSRYLYVRIGSLGVIDAFRVESDGALTSVGGFPSGLAGTAAGIAAR